MKKISMIALILLLMFGTFTTFVLRGLESKKVSVNQNSYSSTVNDTTTIHQLILSEGEFSLGVGESHQCTATFNDDEAAEGVKWFSSNEAVASVDSNGNVTAVAKGEAVITAYISEEVKCSVNVSVYDDMEKSVIDAINNLAVRGSDEDYNEIITLESQFNKSKDISAKSYAALLTALLDYSNIGAGENKDFTELWSNLNAALDGTEIKSLSQDVLRRAALSAYCQGEKSASDITLSFTGDCTLAYFNETDNENMFPAVYRNSGSVTYPFDLTKNIFGADDITMINLECALTESREHKDKQFYFRGEPSYADILTNSSIEAVTVENNHSFDYLDKGFNDTLNYLKNAGIRYTGYTSPAAINKNGYSVVMLSVSMVSTTYKTEFKNKIESYINQYRSDRTIIVVNVHWGTEGAEVPDDWQISAAHSMIDAGADLIIGHHPHRLQGIEEYNGHYIAYSLGNFSFGGNSVASYPDTIILRASFSETSDGSMELNKISAVPCYTTSSGSSVNNFRPTVRFGNNGDSTISYLLSLSEKLDGGIKSINHCKIP